MKTINMNTIKLLALLFISSLAFTGCSDDDDHDDDGDDHGHEEEVITTINYTLTNGTDIIILSYFDLDPDDSIDGVATVTGGNLSANTTYTGVLNLLNANDEDAEHIQEEIEAEADEHEFFFTSSISDIAIEKTDEDSNGYPVGFDTTLSTGEAGDGSLTIVLKHEPTKPNDGTSADAGGSTDIEVSFAIVVE